MEYEFLAEDGKRYMESDAAPHSTPRWVTTSLSYIIVTVRRTISRNVSSGFYNGPQWRLNYWREIALP